MNLTPAISIAHAGARRKYLPTIRMAPQRVRRWGIGVARRGTKRHQDREP
jgi:hypothetical protein